MSSLRVGVVGGGQLARMMIPPAISLGIELRVFAEQPGSPAMLAQHMVGDFRDSNQLLAFAKDLDVLTFEHEHVPQEVLAALVSSGVNIQPPPTALIAAQNKLEMRRRMAQLDLPNPIWMAATSADQVDDFIRERGGQAIAKMAIGGYDGRGVRVINSPVQVTDWLAQLDRLGGALLLEEKVEFRRELAALIARSPSGEIAAWQVVETRQRNGMCDVVISPAQSPVDMERAEQISREIAEGIGVTGMLAVELFEDHSGGLYINELAMRPHNSGHFSIEGSETSQFEQHLRAVLDLPLGSTRSRAKFSVMRNLIGESEATDLGAQIGRAMAKFPEVKFHNYQKAPRSGRKLGHLTASGDKVADLVSLLDSARSIIFSGGAS